MARYLSKSSKPSPESAAARDEGALDVEMIHLAQIEWLRLGNASVDVRAKIDCERVRRATGHLYCRFEVRTVKGRDDPIVTTNGPCDSSPWPSIAITFECIGYLSPNFSVRLVTRQVNPNGVWPPCGQLGDGFDIGRPTTLVTMRTSQREVSISRWAKLTLARVNNATAASTRLALAIAPAM